MYLLVGWASSLTLWVGYDIVVDWRKIIEVIMLELFHLFIYI